MKKNAIEINNLVKIYNENKVLKDISLTVEKGDFFAFLGHNGAGKTTTISILSSLVNKTSGNIKIEGIDIDENFSLAKSKLGIVPQEFNFFLWSTVLEIVVDQAGYYGIERSIALLRAEKLLKKLDLWNKKDSEAVKLSGGMKRRLMIARGLIHDPQILLLDEPTAGVDVELRRGMWDFLKDLNKSGVTIILTTHYLEEAEKLCRNMAIISKGEIVKTGNVQEIISEYKQNKFLVVIKKSTNLKDYKFINYINILKNNLLEITVPEGESLSNILKNSNILGLDILEIKPEKNALEEILIKETDMIKE
jgi:ABC-2 type transport system ATP-binding protein